MKNIKLSEIHLFVKNATHGKLLLWVSTNTLCAKRFGQQLCCKTENLNKKQSNTTSLAEKSILCQISVTSSFSFPSPAHMESSSQCNHCQGSSAREQAMDYMTVCWPSTGCESHSGACRNMWMLMGAEGRFLQDALPILTPCYLCKEEQLKHMQRLCCKTVMPMKRNKLFAEYLWMCLWTICLSWRYLAIDCYFFLGKSKLRDLVSKHVYSMTHHVLNLWLNSGEVLYNTTCPKPAQTRIYNGWGTK